VNPSPHRNPDGTMTSEAMAGEAIFRRSDTRCTQCHIPPRYTDSEINPAASVSAAGGFILHDVGTLKPGSGRRLNDTLKGLDTPTLLGIWETGPYLHDGSAATLMDVITTANPHDRHGNTSHLTEQERKQLVAFILQLDASEAPDRIARGITPTLQLPLSILKTGNGWLFAWNISGIHKTTTLKVYDAAGKQIAQLRGQNKANSPKIEFHWEKPAARPGIFLLQLSLEGGTISCRVYLTP
jgi:hypothetical protein